MFTATALALIFVASYFCKAFGLIECPGNCESDGELSGEAEPPVAA